MLLKKHKVRAKFDRKAGACEECVFVCVKDMSRGERTGVCGCVLRSVRCDIDKNQG